MLRNAGRLASGMPVGIVPEYRSASQRNRGRHRPEYAAEEKGLEKITGMNPQKVHSIVAQARKMTGETEKSQHTWSKGRGQR